MENITNEIFYDELIKALKSDEKVFNLKDVNIKGDIRIGEIYKRIKNDDELKHLILSEKDKTIVYLDVDISIRNVIFKNEIDFYFWDEYVTIYVKFKKVEFKNCIFKEKANFINSTFEWEANFINSIFEGDANFSKSIFKRDADFWDSKFKRNAIFSKLTFEWNADFGNSTFEGYANFSKSIFKNANFSKSIFKNANFSESTFEGYANFSKSTFKENADFIYSTFKNANFNESTFEEDAKFWMSTFEENADFRYSTFERDAEFWDSKFKGNAIFWITFKGNADFRYSTFNNIYFSHSIFNAVTSFLNISYKLLSFKECTFESTTYFKNKEKEEQMPAFFNLVNFKNATFTDFSLSTTSFILTDVKDIAIISNTFEDKKIFDEMLLEITPKEKLEKDELKKKLKENMEKNKLFSNEKILSDDFIEKVTEISPYLRYETVLKEYRDIRKSFEKHRTYSEASKLFIREMDLIKNNSGMSKKIIFNLYKYISGYGESIWIPLKWSIIFIFLFPIIAISFAYLNISPLFIIILSIVLISFAYSNISPSYKIILSIITISIAILINHFLIFYVDTLEQVLRAFFQLKMSPSENVLFITEWEWFIRVVSLILLTNITLTLVKQLKRR